ncbi:MAG TPA: fibronectin type III domain-containing protein [Blastocatellia bacterium]|nr:fibronectin type III domain-containing protein [Blastocatellia bacterium]
MTSYNWHLIWYDQFNKISVPATSYNIKRSTTSEGPFAVVSGATTTTFTNTGLTNGTSYFFVVGAVNSAGESANSAQVRATPAAAASEQ